VEISDSYIIICNYELCVKVVNKSNIQSKTPSRVTPSCDNIMLCWSVIFFMWIMWRRPLGRIMKSSLNDIQVWQAVLMQIYISHIHGITVINMVCMHCPIFKLWIFLGFWKFWDNGLSLWENFLRNCHCLDENRTSQSRLCHHIYLQGKGYLF
jgi:hypothetical protein